MVDLREQVHFGFLFSHLQQQQQQLARQQDQKQ